MSENVVSAKAQCLCKAHTFKATVPASALPLTATCCHCASCRHNHGALYFPDIDWPNRDEDLSALQRYAFSGNTDIFFCGTCSSPMFCRGTQPGAAPGVLTGVLDNTPNLVRYASHIFVGDTIDGGLSSWLCRGHDGSPIKRWTRRSTHGDKSCEELSQDWPSDNQVPRKVPVGETARILCHCRGVDLLLLSAANMSSWAAGELPRFVDVQSYQYVARLDASAAARRSCGADISAWTSTLLSHVVFPEDVAVGAAVQFPQSTAGLKEAVTSGRLKDPRLGTMACYESAIGTERYFCARCSAAVFVAYPERLDEVAVAVGVLDHPGGARVEALLAWELGTVHGVEETAGGWREDIVRGIVKESEAWRVRMGLDQPRTSDKEDV